MHYLLVSDILQDQELNAEGLLISLGVTCKLSGFRYTEYILNKAVKNPSCLQLITKVLYPEVASHFNISGNAVETSIRRLIKVCWDVLGHHRLNEIAGYKLAKRPSNFEFLHILTAYMLRIQSGTEKVSL